MASITCTKCGAVLKTKAPIAAGKKLKCPKCEKVFVVEDEKEKEEAAVADEDTGAEDEGDEQETPKPKKQAKASKDEEDEEDEEDEPKRNQAKKKGKEDGKPNKGGSMVLVIGAVAVLLVCLLLGGGAAGWYFVIRDPDAKKDPVARKDPIIPKDQGKDDDKKGDQDANKKDKKEPSKDKKEPEKDAPSKPDFTLTVEQLTSELRANRKTTIGKYKGKRLEVSGEVDYRGPGSFTMYGVLGKDEDPYRVACDFAPKDEARANGLSRKQKIKVTGKAEIPAGDTTIILRDSTFVELEPSKLVKITAPEIAKILDEGGTLLAKPREHGVLISGTVVETMPNKQNPGSQFIYLETPGKTRFALLMFTRVPPTKGKIIEGSLWDNFIQDSDTKERWALVYLVSVK